MALHEQVLESAIPDLRDVLLDQLVELDDSVLANSIALYQQRLRDNSVPLNSFSSRI
jgi:hypothetical protein